MPRKVSFDPQAIVTITGWEYYGLQQDQVALNALQEWGVDNWSGYEEAMSEVDIHEIAEGYVIDKLKEAAGELR